MSSPAAAEFGVRSLEADEINSLLLRASSLPGADLRMLMYYATAVPVGAAVTKTTTDIGRELGLSTTSASRSIGRLAAGGWLELSHAAVGSRFYVLGRVALGIEVDQEDEAVADGRLAQVHQLRPRV
ncbi:MarR family transcriptional regulator [Kitasatospora sp. NPDC059146]|uniref:MarR family transcriptional regulator n=1 Tax=Kitasatospora sp. NPDC059146 TaxID=3346741 RepID=UPI0036C95E16